MRLLERPLVGLLLKRLQAGHQPVQIVLGPRQVGKTTALEQVAARWKGPSHYATADLPAPPDADWVHAQWLVARQLAKLAQASGIAVPAEWQSL